jgi:predicted aconitase with swiveling domain
MTSRIAEIVGSEHADLIDFAMPVSFAGLRRSRQWPNVTSRHDKCHAAAVRRTTALAMARFRGATIAMYVVLVATEAGRSPSASAKPNWARVQGLFHADQAEAPWACP